MTGTSSFAYSIAVIVAFLLMLLGLHAVIKRRDWKRGILMMLVAVVLIGNVLIWTLPLPTH